MPEADHAAEAGPAHVVHVRDGAQQLDRPRPRCARAPPCAGAGCAGRGARGSSRTGPGTAPTAFWTKRRRSYHSRSRAIDRPADDVRVPAEVLGRRVHDEIGAELERPLVGRRRERVVDRDEAPRLRRERPPRDVDHVQLRVGRSSRPRSAGSRRGPLRSSASEVGLVDQVVRQPPATHHLVDQPDRCRRTGRPGSTMCEPARADHRDQRVLGGQPGGERHGHARPRARRALSPARAGSGWPSARSRSRRRTRRGGAGRRSRSGGWPGSPSRSSGRASARRGRRGWRTHRAAAPRDRSRGQCFQQIGAGDESLGAAVARSPAAPAGHRPATRPPRAPDRRRRPPGTAAPSPRRSPRRAARGSSAARLSRPALADRADDAWPGRARSPPAAARRGARAAAPPRRARGSAVWTVTSERNLAGLALAGEHVADPQLACRARGSRTAASRRRSRSSTGRSGRRRGGSRRSAPRDRRSRAASSSAACSGEAARAAGEDALELGQPARGQERVAVGHRDPAVDHRAVERLAARSPRPTPSTR